jgi:hypothetical protein
MHDDVPALSAESLPVLPGDYLLNPDLAMRSRTRRRHWSLRSCWWRWLLRCLDCALFPDCFPASGRPQPCEETLQPGP